MPSIFLHILCIYHYHVIFNPIGDNTTHVCGFSKQKCFEDSYYAFWQNELTDKSMRNNTNKPCGCLPSCNTIE